jgi:purine nucleoside permease
MRFNESGMTRLPPRLRAARAGLAALGVGVLIGPLAAAPPPSAPIPVKVVVVTMYQNGALDGDQPGEAHLWVGGVTNSSTSIMALGLDRALIFARPTG